MTWVVFWMNRVADLRFDKRVAASAPGFPVDDRTPRLVLGTELHQTNAGQFYLSHDVGNAASVRKPLDGAAE
jgi:hypothetical protein